MVQRYSIFPDHAIPRIRDFSLCHSLNISKDETFYRFHLVVIKNSLYLYISLYVEIKIITNMKKTIITTLLAFIALTSWAQPLLKTHVETGDLEGTPDGTDLAVYKAIPYAAPPVGDLRWKAPQPARPWKGVLKAEDVAKWPPQPEKSYVKYDMMSEDCLYLSVTTPAKSVNDAMPVMVFIHGGGFQTEHYGGDLWQSLARKGVVAVSIESLWHMLIWPRSRPKDTRATMVFSIRSLLCNGYSATSRTSVATQRR